MGDYMGQVDTTSVHLRILGNGPLRPEGALMNLRCKIVRSPLYELRNVHPEP